MKVEEEDELTVAIPQVRRQDPIAVSTPSALSTSCVSKKDQGNVQDGMSAIEKRNEVQWMWFYVDRLPAAIPANEQLRRKAQKFSRNRSTSWRDHRRSIQLPHVPHAQDEFGIVRGVAAA